jgi:hypothetical protein
MVGPFSPNLPQVRTTPRQCDPLGSSLPQVEPPEQPRARYPVRAVAGRPPPARWASSVEVGVRPSRDPAVRVVGRIRRRAGRTGPAAR